MSEKSKPAQYTLRVSEIPSKNPDPTPDGVKPVHWVDKSGSSFVNPWKSWRAPSVTDRLGLIPTILSFPKPPKDIATLMPIRKPTWGLPSAHGTEATDAAAAAQSASENDSKIKTTWLGHACFLVELPSVPGAGRGVRILFDPVFSDRCSPSQWMGPKRFTPPPCTIEDIPEVDAVVISHNHYDHLDTHTIRTLYKRTNRTPHFFAPLGNKSWFQSLGIPTSHTHDMDWWESKRLVIGKSDVSDKKDSDGNTTTSNNSSATKLSVDITCTPGQHFTGRTPFDMFKTLWAGWVVEEVKDDVPTPGARAPTKVYFAGDTAYRSVLNGDNEDDVPVCPAFEAIGKRFGGFDVALIPIGAYLPRDYMSRIHCAPQDSVLLFKDIKAKKAVGMHWGTWILTTEDVSEPPKRLAEECKRRGIDDGDFVVCDIGETLWF